MAGSLCLCRQVSRDDPSFSHCCGTTASMKKHHRLWHLCYLLHYEPSAWYQAHTKLLLLQHSLDELVRSVHCTGNCSHKCGKFHVCNFIRMALVHFVVSLGRTAEFYKRSGFSLCKPCWHVLKDRLSQGGQLCVLSTQLTQGFIDPETESHKAWLPFWVAV